MINPYADTNWITCKRIVGVTHQHLSHSMTGFTPQSAYDDIYSTGVKLFAISRYRPSITTYPFDYDNGTFVYVANPFTSTDDINTLKQEYSFTVNMASDVIGILNAEQVYPYIYINGVQKKWNNIHINSLGSTYESGTVPNPDTGYKSGVGLNMSYEDAYDNILANLQYSDGGGIIVNHMNWTDETRSVDYDIVRFVMDSLDYDERVLGTDMVEGGHQYSIAPNTERIDTILSTGRRCWIFCQGDWNRQYGRNVLLLPSNFDNLTKAEQEHECLKAYRNGSFYSRLSNTNLDITSLSYENGVYSISVANADKIVITVDGVATEYNGTTASQTISSSAVYVRAMAYVGLSGEPNEDGDQYDDILFTNPIMVNPVTHTYDPAYAPSSNPDPEPYDPQPSRFSLLYWG